MEGSCTLLPSPPLLSLFHPSLTSLSSSSPLPPHLVPLTPPLPPSSLSLASSSSPRSPYPSSPSFSRSPLSGLPPPTVHLLATPMAPSNTTTVPKRTLPPSPAPSTAPHHTPRTRPLTHTGPHTLIHLAGSHDPIKPPRSCGD